MIERHFGEASALSVGVEEELMILDAATLEQRAEVDAFVAAAKERGLEGRLKHELFASVVEVNTSVCASAGEALEQLGSIRAVAREIGARRGLVLAGGGTHPLTVPEEQEIVDDPDYRAFVDYAGPSARMQGVNGLHVHVAMPDADACHRTLEGVLPWLPVVLALSANSPYFRGVETGMLSTRAEVLSRLPRAGAPPVFGSYAEWEARIESWIAIGLIDRYTRVWWDARLHPRFGTLELRVPDQPTALALTGAFIALLQALCAVLLRDPVPTAADRGAYAQNRWAAARFGPRAALIHPDGSRLVPASELAGELLERVRPAARELGAEQLLEPLTPGACEGDRQLEVGRGQGLRAVCADLVERSLRSGA